MIKIGIVGAKNSGKTTLIEALVKLASDDGLNVTTIKHTSHSHSFDTPGKDSFRHRIAGAKVTIAISEKEFALFMNPEPNQVEAVCKNILNFFNICFVEGDKNSDRQKILLTNNIEDINFNNLNNIIATYGDDLINMKAEHFSRSEADKLYLYLKKNYFNKAGVVND